MARNSQITAVRRSVHELKNKILRQKSITTDDKTTLKIIKNAELELVKLSHSLNLLEKKS